MNNFIEKSRLEVIAGGSPDDKVAPVC